MLTAKGKYGLKALVCLASLPPEETIQASDIAGSANIPKKFLDAILGELRNAGIVHSKKGPGGGYTLARAASDIQIGHVIRTLDGPLAPIACASRTAYHPCRDCKDVKACAVRLTMTRVRDATSEILDRMTIADMLNEAPQPHARAHHPKRKSGRTAATGRLASRKAAGIDRQRERGGRSG